MHISYITLTQLWEQLYCAVHAPAILFSDCQKLARNKSLMSKNVGCWQRYLFSGELSLFYRMAVSVAILAEISPWSPRKLFIFIIKKIFIGSKYQEFFLKKMKKTSLMAVLGFVKRDWKCARGVSECLWWVGIFRWLNGEAYLLSHCFWPAYFI